MSNTELPDTIVYGKGCTMTFLRNDSRIVRNHISGEPDADTLYVPPHWHETHDEIFHIVKGKVEYRVGDTVAIYGPEDGEIRIPKFVIHSVRSLKGVECVIDEWTGPVDDEKELLFRNLIGKGKLPTNLFDVMLTCYYGDVRPAFPGHFLWLERGFVTLIGGYLAPLLGYELAVKSLKKI